jgi:hypothetical protein
MTDIFDDIFDEAGALGDVNTQTGKTLSDLVRKLRSVEKEIEDAEAHVKALKQEKHKLSVENIPALMDEMGVERLDVDGVTVVRKMMVHASIPERPQGRSHCLAPVRGPRRHHQERCELCRSAKDRTTWRAT